MSHYFLKEHLQWAQAPVRGGTVMSKSIVWEGQFDIRSAFFRMPKGMTIPRHTHPGWVQVMVVEGEMQIDTDDGERVLVAEGGCYFVEPGDSHIETALLNTLVFVTQAEDRPEFLPAA